MTQAVNVRGIHDSLHSRMLKILATDFCLLAPRRFRDSKRSRNDWQCERTPQHEARQLTLLPETDIPPDIFPSDNNDSLGLPNNKHHSVSARGSSWSSWSFLLKVASQTTHWGIIDFWCNLRIILSLSVEFKRCDLICRAKMRVESAIAST